jgi:hypothetical protein
MRGRTLFNITLGITTEVVYALLMIAVAFVACLVFYIRK